VPSARVSLARRLDGPEPNGLSDDDAWKMIAYIRFLYAGDKRKINW
jgi:hypothetical protein